MTGPIDAKFLSQWEAVRIAALDRDIRLARSAELSGNRTTPAYVYEQDHVFVHAEDVDTVVDHHLDADPVEPRNVGDLHMFRIGEDAIAAIDRLNAVGSLKTNVVRPNHLMSICPVQMCPADEPVPVPVGASEEPHPPRTAGDGGRDVRVEVLDTGLVPNFAVGHEWLADVADYQQCSSFGPAGTIKEYAGHGTFVTGVLRCAAPATDVTSRNVFQFAGATMEDMLARSLLEVLGQAVPPHIISLSAGGTTLGGNPHAALEPVLAKLSDPANRTLLVAAAGNDGSTQRFYPAAYATDTDAVVSVGALRQDGKGRACFSNHGDWVKVYALGERHVNAFMSGAYTYVDPQRDDLTCRFYPHERLYCACTCVTMPPQGAMVAFRGMARWSGTSFATPLVAGIIAPHMSTTGEMDARKAAQQVLATARYVSDDGGKVAALDYSPL